MLTSGEDKTYTIALATGFSHRVTKLMTQQEIYEKK